MNSTPLLLALIGHLVGDYILQNDWLAIGKKKSTAICAIHAWIWTCCVCGFAGWPNWLAPLSTSHTNWVWTLLFITHLVQDRFNLIPWWMKLIGQNQFMKSDELLRKECPPIEGGKPLYFLRIGLGPWSVIIVDNIFHILTIWAVWRFVV